jgi:hypothetical protein
MTRHASRLFLKPVDALLLGALHFYRWVLSPAKALLFGPLGRCRFTPSCSAYAVEAIQRHGGWSGSWLALKRVCRCHPWGQCGLDPVPAERRAAGRALAPSAHERPANRSENSPRGVLAQETA